MLLFLSALGVSGLGRDVVQVLMTVCLIIPSLPPAFQALLLLGAKARAEGPNVILSLVPEGWDLRSEGWGRPISCLV